MWVHPDSVFSLQKEVDLQKHHVSIHMLHYLNMFLDNVQRLVMRKTSLSYLLKAYCKIFVYQSRHCGIYIYMYVCIYIYVKTYMRASLVAQLVKNPLAMRETWV